MCGLDITFIKSILYKRIVIKFFWEYCLNSQVCNYGKRAMIGLLRAVIVMPQILGVPLTTVNLQKTSVSHIMRLIHE